MMSLISVIKTHESRPLDHDRAVEMRSSLFHQSHYNSFNLATCSDLIRWSARPRDRRVDFQCDVDPTLLPSPCALHS